MSKRVFEIETVEVKTTLIDIEQLTPLRKPLLTRALVYYPVKKKMLTCILSKNF
jgi:hypothetical protein